MRLLQEILEKVQPKIVRGLGGKKLDEALGINQPKLPAFKKAVPLPVKPRTEKAPKTVKPSPITGAVNPLEQMKRGQTVYSPGEGPAQPNKKRRF